MEDGTKERVDITVTVQGGLICDIDIPEHLSNVVVVVKDYDVEGGDTPVLKDEDGEYRESEWEYSD